MVKKDFHTLFRLVVQTLSPIPTMMSPNGDWNSFWTFFGCRVGSIFCWSHYLEAVNRHASIYMYKTTFRILTIGTSCTWARVDCANNDFGIFYFASYSCKVYYFTLQVCSVFHWPMLSSRKYFDSFWIVDVTNDVINNCVNKLFGWHLDMCSFSFCLGTCDWCVCGRIV